MKKITLVTGLVFISISTLIAQQWQTTEIAKGIMKQSYDIEIGDGRNDGRNRLYVSGHSGGVHEWSFDSIAKSWNQTLISDAGTSLEMLALGDGRNDGINRLYFTEFVGKGKIYEATWGGSSWNVVTIATNVQSLCCFIGKGRNTSTNYLYIGTNNGLFEYFYNGTAWVKTQMHFSGLEGVGQVADGRNDGVNRVYSDGNFVREFSWGGSNYTWDEFETVNNGPDASFVGDGRNDGVNRVYVNAVNKNGTNKGRLEYTYSSGTWVVTQVDPVASRGDFMLAKLKSDGKNRLYGTQAYAACCYTAGPLREFEWNGSKWIATNVVPVTSGATAMIIAGDGRNDDTVRLYAPHYENGSILEITSTTPYVTTPKIILKNEKVTIDNDVQIDLYPIPSTDKKLNIAFKNIISDNVLVTAYDLLGKQVYSDRFFQLTPGTTKELNLTNLKSGFYVFNIENEGFKKQIKFELN